MNDFHLVCSIYFYTKTLSGNFLFVVLFIIIEEIQIVNMKNKILSLQLSIELHFKNPNRTCICWA
jgi:hypothetical protein